MRTIGIDLSLKECKQQGYLMIKYDGRKKFNKEKQYNIFSFIPEWCRDHINQIDINIFMSFNDVIEIYTKYKKEIDSFADTNNCVNFDTPDIWDLLTLADNVNAYCGLE